MSLPHLPTPLPPDITYLDHAGTPPAALSLLSSIFHELQTSFLANPHSHGLLGAQTLRYIEQARLLVLQHFNASPAEYSVVFTSGASAALKLVGESFPWDPRSRFCHTLQNHTSVLGIREFATAAGCSVSALAPADPAVDSQFGMKEYIGPKPRPRSPEEEGEQPRVFSLFAFPGECNFSGQKFDLDAVNLLKGRGEGSEGSEGDDPFLRQVRALRNSSPSGEEWLVLLDAAKLVSTSPLDLEMFPADFVTISFYKMFGFPTGIGALLVRNASASVLRRGYFGGGTLDVASPDVDFKVLTENISARFEDGTLPFHSICSLVHGFRQLGSFGMDAVRQHVQALVELARTELESLQHANGAPVVTIYGFRRIENHGSILSLNVLHPDSSFVGYDEVEDLATRRSIQLRTGCHCNLGACRLFLGQSHETTLRNYEAGHRCGDKISLVNGQPTGAVRISFGLQSTSADVAAFVRFIRESFVVSARLLSEVASLSLPRNPESRAAGDDSTSPSVVVLDKIVVYPIKSCQGVEVARWPLSPTQGLLYDREWAVVGPRQSALSIKQYPVLSQVRLQFDLEREQLCVNAPDMKELRIPLKGPGPNPGLSEKMEVRVCGVVTAGMTEASEADEWFSRLVGEPCRLSRSLKRQGSLNKHHTMSTAKREIAFANEAQVSLMSLESARHFGAVLHALCETEGGPEPPDVSYQNFRPNFVVSGALAAFAENSWRRISIGDLILASTGPCERCTVINHHPTTGVADPRPLRALNKTNPINGRGVMGQLFGLSQDSAGDSGMIVAVGAKVAVEDP